MREAYDIVVRGPADAPSGAAPRGAARRRGTFLGRAQFAKLAQVERADTSNGDDAAARSNRWLRAAGPILLLTIATYSPALRGGFIWDDDQYLTANPVITQPGGLRRIWLTSDCPQYYPLVFTSFWIEHRLWGFRPGGYHAVNVALHALNALLIGIILTRLHLRGAWFAAAIFAVHPVHVESVAWVTERKNVLGACFYLLAFQAYLRFEEQRWRRQYGLSLLLFVAALLSKTVMCSLPVALLVVNWARGRRIQRGDWLRLAPFFAAGLAMAGVTVWLERHKVGAIGAEFDLGLAQRFILAGQALWFYAGKLVWPAGLSFIYPRWALDDSAPGSYVAPFAFAAVVALLWSLRWRAGRWPIAGTAFFALTLFPALGFISVYPMRYSFVADHFQYVASIGLIALLCGASAGAVQRLRRAADRAGWAWKAWWPRAAAIGIVLLPAFFAWMQTFSFLDEPTLWRDTIARNPSAWLAHNNLGLILLRQGQVEPAIAHLRTAVELHPQPFEGWTNLGIALAQDGQSTEAMAACRRAVALAPAIGRTHINLAYVLAQAREHAEAIEEYRAGLRLEPGDLNARVSLCEVLETVGEPGAARQTAREALAAAAARRPAPVAEIARAQAVLARLETSDR